MTEALDYDTAPIGETMGPFAYVVPVDFNRRRLPPLSVADASSLRDADGREIAEPSLLCGQHTWVGRQRYHWAGSVHAKCEAEFLEPVHVGSRIEVSLRIAGKYERAAAGTSSSSWRPGTRAARSRRACATPCC
ncbi:MAG: hypothetical protein IPK81_03205 [Rhodospirillales bacterium]|nr:MAG: hypothetical protein IPK81_03205 [Rhodospirillales bacterium]